MLETAILQQEPVMTSEVKLSETETICMLDKSATEAPRCSNWQYSGTFSIG
jgi:hypothetical protein